MTLADRAPSRDNAFDEIRFAAAAGVIFSHAFPLSGEKWEPVLWATGFQSLGAFCVYTFFILSGFLISKSWCEKPLLFDYLKRRMFRIYPGLAAATLFAVLVVGPLVTTYPLHKYCTDRLTIKYLSNLLVYKMNFSLPGVFEHTPATGINGSLWTLPIEWFMYACVPLAAVVGLRLRSRGRQLLAASTILLFALDWHWAARAEHIGRNLFHVNFQSGMQCVIYFSLGTLYYAYRDVVRLSASTALLAAGLMTASFYTVYAKLACFLALPYLVLWAAYSLRPSPLRRFGDPSYGMYVYSYPIQQLCIHLFPSLNWAGLFALSFVLTLGVAMASWRYIEKPCMNLVRKKKPFGASVLPLAKAA